MSLTDSWTGRLTLDQESTWPSVWDFLESTRATAWGFFGKHLDFGLGVFRKLLGFGLGFLKSGMSSGSTRGF